MLTKKQIEAIEIGGRDDEWEMSGDLSMDDARELRRLALLGLETEAKLARVDADTGDWFARSYGAFPDLEPDTEPARDTRAERIGRAVIAWVGDDEPKQLRSYASDLEADHWPVGADLVRAIAAALEEEA
jgi:hypothetical protein